MSDPLSNEGHSDISEDEAIIQAIHQMDVQTLGELLEKRKQNPVPLAADDQGRTALHLAASRPEYKECLELLLQLADGMLDLDAKTRQRKTALEIATEEGCEENVLLLLQKGCNPSSGNVYTAASIGNCRIVEYLLRYLKNEHILGLWKDGVVLRLAQANDHMEAFHLLLRKGASIRSTGVGGNLPLHYICQLLHLDTSYLFQYADLSLINKPNDKGVTPFMYAVQKFDLPGVRHLLENGARTDVYDCRTKGALHYAAEGGRADVLQLLLQFTDLAQYYKYCLATFPCVGLNVARSFCSLTCSALPAVHCLDLLLTSGLPRSILQMPNIIKDSTFQICPPLAYLFEHARGTNKQLISCLQLLLKHKIIMVDEFYAEFPVEWPRSFFVTHPFKRIIRHSESNLNQLFEILIANGVTTDYCLQCYHDNSKSFHTFRDYVNFYMPLIYPMMEKNIEILKLLVSNSVILEPDKLLKLCNWLVNYKELECYWSDVHQYLMRLSPIDCIRVIRSYPQVAWIHLSDIIDGEFSRTTLQQLCRTAIRQHLREPSLEGNLRNFRRKILELPLPNLLKDHLLFKN